MKPVALGVCRKAHHFSLSLLVVLLAVFVWSGCSFTTTRESPSFSEKISMALTREPLGSLMVVALEKGFFADEGLNVTIVDKYPSGKRALLGLLEGEVTLAPTSEVPIVFRSFERDDFAVVATIGSSDNEPKIVARRDTGIEKPADLRGKRLATQRASAVHYFLHLFLLRHGIAESDVELCYFKAEELPPALAAGRIDAFSMREPFVSEARRLLGAEAIVFCEPGLYVKTFNLVVRKQAVSERPEAIRRVLRALVRAEQFARKHAEEAIGIVARRLQVDRVSLGNTWTELDLRISLGQQLLGALEDEARWALGSGFVEGQPVPNYLDLIHVDALDDVKATAVTVIH